MYDTRSSLYSNQGYHHSNGNKRQSPSYRNPHNYYVKSWIHDGIWDTDEFDSDPEPAEELTEMVPPSPRITEETSFEQKQDLRK
jgi:hypothetical protein